MFNYEEDCVPRRDPMALWEIALVAIIGTGVPFTVALLVTDYSELRWAFAGYLVGMIVAFAAVALGRHL